MWYVVQLYQLAEIRINCNQNTVVCFRKFQQCSIAGIGTKKSSFDGVVPGIAEPLGEAAPHAPVYEKPHRLAIDTAARESSAMTARA